MRISILLSVSLIVSSANAQDKARMIEDTPKAIPLHRVQMKQALESLKGRSPRLPFPTTPLTEPTVTNGRFREFYLPKSWSSMPRPASPSPAGSATPSSKRQVVDPAMTLDNTFKVRLFWIVSRVNNCHYCLGHQEMKLLRAGMDEDRIASLDFDWQLFPEEERAAFAFARRLSLQPHLVTCEDIENLARFYSDKQLVELVQTVASFNSTNRWTDALGLPQDQQFGNQAAVLLTETSPKHKDSESSVAVTMEPARPDWESRERMEERLVSARSRTPCISLVDPSSIDPSTLTIAERLRVPNYARALAHLPTTAKLQLRSFQAIMDDGRTPAELKAKIVWTVARENRAWYSLNFASHWLAGLGVSEEQRSSIGLDSENVELNDTISFVRKLTSHPRQITDQDIAHLQKTYSDHEVAEIVFLTGYSNMFCQFTESLQLPLEP